MAISTKFQKDPQNALIGGVCAGLAKGFGIERKWVRLALLVGLLLSTLPTAIIYIIACVTMPPQSRWLD